MHKGTVRNAVFGPALAVLVMLAFVGTCCAASYEAASSLGRAAAQEALKQIKAESGKKPVRGDLIVMTDAGYAEIEGQPTMGALDGLSAVTGASRGRNTLIELHASYTSPLWFAVYDKSSGQCAYLEAATFGGTFTAKRVARVDIAWLRANAEQAKQVLETKPFGGNEFRIITAANAVAAGAAASTVRAFEFHDHFCPGVSSGILMAEYLKRNFAPGPRGYFVHSLNPWCKEDALLSLLNATPGKQSYYVSYPGEAELAARTGEAKQAATIFYRQNAASKTWEGLVLGCDFGETAYAKTGNTLIDKLNTDLYLLENRDHPEKFVKVVKRFELPKGLTPMDWTRPGVDPLKELGLLK
ncbi:MAG: FmdE, Molybdenum formylmethanofuran dehydrogenase operon [Deltaproteobacteria bacterium ADurb.Bin510]|nr:MAG: FmdE, Molybdenum formylmethanofuran dehydrogenase operon [Deltaproteobacteria bacterium ADurb.Bin510]